MSQNRKPTHPGELIREDLLAEAGLSQNKLAQRIHPFHEPLVARELHPA
jgi:plasmid maintenance system antidote protein VapI